MILSNEIYRHPFTPNSKLISINLSLRKSENGLIKEYYESLTVSLFISTL